MHRTLTTCTATIENCVFRKGMILPKREDGFFPEREDLPLLEVTVEMGLWYGLTSDCSNSDQDCKRGKEYCKYCYYCFLYNCHCQNKYSTASLISKLEPIYCLTKIHRILQENQCSVARSNRRRKAEKLKDFISYR